MRKVEVTQYNKDWPLMYEEEAEKRSEIIEIYHIGSTSVDGLIAKPVIDIIPVVRDVNKVDDFKTAMIDIGYEPKGEHGLSWSSTFPIGRKQTYSSYPFFLR